MIDRPSPNHDGRADGVSIDMLVIHYTGMRTGAEALARLCDPAAKVSAHYVIEEDGRVFCLIPESRRAWHAGVSSWRGQRDVNARSIGIELVNPGHEFGYRDFPAEQMASLIGLSRQILGRHAIPARNVVGHSDIAPARKTDPGERFDWPALARAGIGLWPAALDAPGNRTPRFTQGDRDPAIADTQHLLARYGYEVPDSGMLDEATATVLVAFQRHFRPSQIDGCLDEDCRARIRALVALANA